jgi:cytochrome P450
MSEPIDPIAYPYTDHQIPFPNNSPWLIKDVEGQHVVYQFEDVQALTRDPRLLRSPATDDDMEAIKDIYPNLYWIFNNSPIENSEVQDEDEHKRVRKFFNMAFSKSALEKWHKAIEQTAEQYIKEISLQRGEFNFYESIRTFPIKVAFNLLKIDYDHELADRFQRLFTQFLSSYTLSYSTRVDQQYMNELIAEGDKALGLARETFGNWLDEDSIDAGSVKVGSIKVDSDSYINELIEANRACGFNHEQKIAGLVSILAGSADTVAITICLFVRSLLRNPSTFEQLKTMVKRNDEQALDKAIWELIRFDAASKGVIRFIREDFDYKDHHFKKGEMVFLSNLLADRDPAQFENPEQIDLTRDNAKQTLQFGFGLRSCPGKNLAHKELKELVRQLVHHVGDRLYLVNDGEAEWEPRHYLVRLLKTLTVGLR